MHKIYIGLGTNLGDRHANLQTAIARLQDVGDIVEKSSIYQSAPLYKTDQDYFWNAVIAMEAKIDPDPLLSQLKGLEVEMGRLSGERYGPRIIDIDILLYGDRVMKASHLNIPHTGIVERAFVLMPLIELVGDDYILPAQNNDLRHYLSKIKLAPQDCQKLSINW